MTLNNTVTLGAGLNGTQVGIYFGIGVESLGGTSYRMITGPCPFPDQSHNTTKYQNFTYVDSTGAIHSFPTMAMDSYGCYDGHDASETTFDGTGLTADASLNADGTFNHFTVTDISGKQISDHTTTDLNGNTLSVSGSVYTDTMGQTALTSHLGLHTPTDPDTYSYTDANGTMRTISVNYNPLTWQTNWACPNYHCF